MYLTLLARIVVYSVTLIAVLPSANAQWPLAPGKTTGQAAQQPQYPDVNQGGSQRSDVPPESATNDQQDAAADRQHGVARISVVQGDVNVKRSLEGGGAAELTAAVINAPLATDDRLQTANGSRSEIQFDSANLVRLAPDTDVGLANLAYHRVQIQLGAGTIIDRVLRSSDTQVEIDTPSVGFRPLGVGEFRISVLDDGATQITARSGEAEIFGPRGSERLSQGQTILVRGDPTDPQFQNINEPTRDQFDDWSAQRDSELTGSQSYRYVSPEIEGAEDLDRYGSWVPSEYGQAWAPQAEPADWSPYSSGQWSWQNHYGWTWVDSAPWGWAPYHYGRWFRNAGYGWCWWPGPIRASYAWSPALVGFFGWGGFGAGFGLGGLGWVPLAPYESYHRWWGGYGRGWNGDRYGNRGFGSYRGFTRDIDIARTYRNASYRGAAITARYNSFGGPHQRFSPATRAQLTNVSSFRGGQFPLSPTRASLHFSNRSVAPNPRLASVTDRRFFQVPQRSGQLGVARSAERPSFSTPQTQHGVPPNLQGGYRTRNGAAFGAARSSNGWQRFGDPGSGSAPRQSFRNGSEGSGWHSFGQPQRGTSSRPSPAPETYRSSRPAPTPRSYGPNFAAPRSNPAYTAPSYRSPGFNQPRPVTPSFSSPRGSSPAYNAPRPGNGGGFSRGSSPAPRSFSGAGRSGGFSGGRGPGSAGGGRSAGGVSHSSGGGRHR